jgi:hypothetical protein
MTDAGIVACDRQGLFLVDYELARSVSLIAEPLKAAYAARMSGNVFVAGERILVMSRDALSAFAPLPPPPEPEPPAANGGRESF